MANVIQLKRKTVSGQAPGNSDVVAGELVINTEDGLIFYGKTDGTKANLSDTYSIKAGNTSLTTVGALGAGSIATGFGAIDNGTSNITTGGLLSIDTDADADDNTNDSTSGRLAIGASGDLGLYHGGTNSYIVNKTGNLYIHSETDDSDIIFTGEDGSSGITAGTFDMSHGGRFTTNEDIVAGGEVTSSGNMNCGGGTINLSGTGRIIGIDTVSGSTDAASKAYVDTEVAGAGGGSSAADDISTGDAAVTIGTSSGSVTLDAATDVILDAASGITHIRDAGDADDELKITVAGGTGATTIETISDGADGHLTVKADGDLQISATSASEKSVISTTAGVLNENTQFIYVVTAGMSKVGTSSRERHLSFNTTSGNSVEDNGDLFNHYHLMPFPAKLVSIRGSFSASVAGSTSTFFRLRKAADNATSLSDVYKWNAVNTVGFHEPDALTAQSLGGAGDSFEFLDACRGSATVEQGTSGIQTFNEGDKIFGGFSLPSSIGTNIRGCFTFVFVATTGYTSA